MKHAENTVPASDKLRQVIALLVLAVAVVLYYLMTDLPLVVRIAMVLVGLGAAVGLMWSTQAGAKARKHLQDTRREVAQVVWPTRDQAVRMTLIVFGAVVMVGIFLWLVDMFFLWGVETMTGRGD